jgi:hypothetical protein
VKGRQERGGDASEGSGEEMTALKGTGSRSVAVERTRGNGGAASGGGRPRGAAWSRIAAKACERTTDSRNGERGGRRCSCAGFAQGSGVVCLVDSTSGPPWAMANLGFIHSTKLGVRKAVRTADL